MSPPEMSKTTAAALDRLRVPGASVTDVLVRQTPSEGGFSLVRLQLKPNLPLARHSHDADCMYYVIAGSAVMGRQALSAGDAFFVPAGAPYAYAAGPDGVDVLEIRHGVFKFHMRIHEQSDTRWNAMADIVDASREEWNLSQRAEPSRRNDPQTYS
jgi:quercetin dioxygenase-like cupin family protein